MKQKIAKAVFIGLSAWLSLVFFSMPNAHVSAGIQDNVTPDNNTYYNEIPISDPGVVLLDNAEPSTDGNAIVSYNTDKNVITVDYGVTNAMNGKLLAPSDVCNSTVTVTNNTTQSWELDTSKSMRIFLWGYIMHGNNAAYNTYDYYKSVLDRWIMFKFNIIGPDGNNVSVSPYAAITDYNETAGYHFPGEDDSHIMLDATSSLEGDYYAKAMLSVPHIVLKPGESMQIPWSFAVSWKGDNGIQNMLIDFNFRLAFNRIADQTYLYTVKYYRDTVDAGNLLGSKSGTTPFAADYQLTQSDVETDLGEDWINAYKPENYDNGKVDVYPVITIDETKNVVHVVYTKTPVPPVNKITYIVKYYRDTVDVSNLLGSKNGITLFEIDYQLTQTDITTDLGEDWINAYRPDGYDNGKTEVYPTITIDETRNVVHVVYTKTTLPPIDPNDTQEVPEVKPPNTESNNSIAPNTGQQDSLTTYVILLLGSFCFMLKCISKVMD